MPRDKRFLYLAAGCIFLILAPSPLHAQTGTGSIAGKVMNGVRFPLTGATVSLISEDGKESAGASTDGTGAYRFAGLKPGRYTVIFDAPDLVTKTERVNVKPGHICKVNPFLRAKKATWTWPPCC